MDKQKGKNEALFTSKLDKGEELIWLGQSQRKTRQVLITSLLTTLLQSILMAIYLWLYCAARCSADYAPPYWGVFFFVLLPLQLLLLRKSLIERRNFYAISTKRFFICEDNCLNSYSLYRFTDVVLSKPKHGLADISLYAGSTVSKELPKPIFQLKYLAKADAQSAYEILRQAREEALEDRARKHGME